MATRKEEWINERAWAYAAVGVDIAEANRAAASDYVEMTEGNAEARD